MSNLNLISYSILFLLIISFSRGYCDSPVWLSIDSSVNLDSLDSLKPYKAFRAINAWGINLKKAKLIADSEKKFLDKLKNKSIDFSGMFGLLAIKDGDYSDEFINKVCTVNPLGNKITFDKIFHHGNPSSKLWQKELLSLTDILLKSGCNMLEIDQPALESWRGESYDDNTIYGFSRFLSKKYSTKELNEKFSIKNIKGFDYRDFLKKTKIKSLGKSLASLNEGDRLLLSPLGYDFFYFQINDNRKNIFHLIDSIRDKTNKNRNLKIFGNIWGMASEYMPPARKFDILEVACDLITPWDWNPSNIILGPPKNSWVPVYKLAKAFDSNKDILSFLDTNGYVRALKIFKNQYDFLTILSSEALGCGVDFVFPLKNRVAPLQKKGFSKDVIKKIIPFYRKNISYFKENKSYAKVGIFINYKPLIAERFSRLYWGLNYILMDNQVDYDVIFSGDGDIFPDSLSLENIKKYKLIFVPHSDLLSKHQESILNKYIKQGGKLIFSGNKVINSRSFARLNTDFFSYYLKDNNKPAIRTMLALSTLFPKLPIKIDHSIKGLRLFTSKSKDSLNILLVNSNYNKNYSKVSAIKKFSIRISYKKRPKSILLTDNNGNSQKLIFKYRFNEIEISNIIVENTSLIKIID